MCDEGGGGVVNFQETVQGLRSGGVVWVFL